MKMLKPAARVYGGEYGAETNCGWTESKDLEARRGTKRQCLNQLVLLRTSVVRGWYSDGHGSPHRLRLPDTFEFLSPRFLRRSFLNLVPVGAAAYALRWGILCEASPSAGGKSSASHAGVGDGYDC
jgi:hypothetical protein